MDLSSNQNAPNSKVFYGQRTFSEFPEKDKGRQRRTLVFVLIALKNLVSFTMASNGQCNFDLELADDFMEVTETLTAVVGDNVSALYLLLYLNVNVYVLLPIYTHRNTHTFTHSLLITVSVHQRSAKCAGTSKHCNTEILKHITL
jgi:hypothetical protein